ncbi:MAG: NAD(P)-dependent dehydrogenase (short-subunit alcohol dehydrogenase family) [Saprospiraceae bacterium]|jgi:NAD(P)-dependent dehydrogenase (short-subunit alcohol dehydrogenase family)
MEFKNKVVIITGAGSGIGAACAELFASKGATVVVSDINIENAKAVVDKCNAQGKGSMAIKTDVTNYAEVELLITETIAKYGKIDIMINNAGVMNKTRSKTADHSFDDWNNVIAINQTGVFHCLRASLKIMEKQGYGNIVNIASLAGLKASGYNLAYSASKFAVVGMTKSAALEYGSKNIRINAVCPSYTQTPMLDAAVLTQPGIDQKLLKHVPMGRFGDVEEIAEAVIWLASEKTSFITGQTITLDGGLSL